VSDADRTTALVDSLLDGLESRRSEAVEGGSEVAGGEVSSGSEIASGREVATLLEVGIGTRTDVAEALVDRGVAVTAIDVVERSVPEGVAFQQVDVTEADPAAFEGVEGVYALRLPPELQRPVADIAERFGSPAAFTTLGGDPPVVAVRPEQLRGGETLYWLTE